LRQLTLKKSLTSETITSAKVNYPPEDLGLRILPYTAHHAFYLFDLPAHHADPFDRQIIAQAVCEKIPVVTCDEKFSLYKDLKVLW
jgi:PIN domain nuclease of toxin-antitoxin system